MTDRSGGGEGGARPISTPAASERQEQARGTGRMPASPVDATVPRALPRPDEHLAAVPSMADVFRPVLPNLCEYLLRRRRAWSIEQPALPPDGGIRFA